MEPGLFGEQRRGGSISWMAVIIGVVIGIGIGLLYTWEIDPVVERNTAPWQLGDRARQDYVLAIVLSYAYDPDIELAFDRLRMLRPSEGVWSMVADVACERHKNVLVRTQSDIKLIRVVEQLYRNQGAAGCADGVYALPTPLPTRAAIATFTPTATEPPPAPTKTPTLAPTTNPDALSTPVASPRPATTYVAYPRPAAFCDPGQSGVIQVQVRNRNGEGVAGVPVEVKWAGNERETFFTGLKPGQSPGYADFEMATVAGRSYSVSIPGLEGNAPSVDVEACDEADGRTIYYGYNVTFQEEF